MLNQQRFIKLSSSLKTGKSSGPDSISPKVIRNCIHYFVDPLCDIFNKSLNNNNNNNVHLYRAMSVRNDTPGAIVSFIVIVGIQCTYRNSRCISLTFSPSAKVKNRGCVLYTESGYARHLYLTNFVKK